MSVNENDMLHKYLQAAQMQKHCTQSGDYKKGNAASKKLIKYNSKIDENFHKYKLIVDTLLDSDDILSHLRTIANSKDIGIFRLNAEMQLQKIERQLKAPKKI